MFDILMNPLPYFIIIPTLLEKFWRISMYVTDDTICMRRPMCRKVQSNGRKFRHIELSNIASSVKFSNSVCEQCHRIKVQPKTRQQQRITPLNIVQYLPPIPKYSVRSDKQG